VPFQVKDEDKPKVKPGTSSEFELRPTPQRAPSDSVFDTSDELALDEGSSVNLGSSYDITAASATSGINLQHPSDKGIPLGDSSDETVTYESAPKGGPSGTTPRPAKKVKKTEAPESSSEFELTLEDDSGLAPLEPEKKEADSVPSLSLKDEESSTDTSDFELALEEDDLGAEGDTGSEVIVVDDEVGESEATAVRAQALEEDVSDVLGEEEDELAVVSAAEEEEPVTQRAVVAAPAPPAEWGAWSLLHVPTTLILLFTGFLLFEMLRSVWGYGSGGVVNGPVFNMLNNIMK
jgi:hypothetical protein